MEYARRFRDVKYFETIFELLARQYEVAKIDEARDLSLVQVLDKAIEPEEKSKPRRFMIVLFVGFVATFLSILFAFLMESAERSRDDPQQAELLQLLRAYLWRR